MTLSLLYNCLKTLTIVKANEKQNRRKINLKIMQCHVIFGRK